MAKRKEEENGRVFGGSVNGRSSGSERGEDRSGGTNTQAADGRCGMAAGCAAWDLVGGGSADGGAKQRLAGGGELE